MPISLGNTPTLSPWCEVNQIPQGALELIIHADGVALYPTAGPIPGGQPDEWITPNVSTAFLSRGSLENGFEQITPNVTFLHRITGEWVVIMAITRSRCWLMP